MLNSICRLLALLTMGLFMVISGCGATTPKANLAKFNQSTEPIYPAISVITTSDELQYYKNRKAFLNALKEANVFKNIEIDNPFSEFAMEVYLETKNNLDENHAEAFAKGLVIGGTLGLVPVGIEFETQGTVKLRFRGAVFEEFDFRSEYKDNVSLYDVDNKDVGIFGSYRKSVEKILEEIGERRPFEKLFKELNDDKEEEYKIGI